MVKQGIVFAVKDLDQKTLPSQMQRFNSYYRTRSFDMDVLQCASPCRWEWKVERFQTNSLLRQAGPAAVNPGRQDSKIRYRVGKQNGKTFVNTCKSTFPLRKS